MDILSIKCGGKVRNAFAYNQYLYHIYRISEGFSHSPTTYTRWTFQKDSHMWFCVRYCHTENIQRFQVHWREFGRRLYCTDPGLSWIYLFRTYLNVRVYSFIDKRRMDIVFPIFQVPLSFPAHKNAKWITAATPAHIYRWYVKCYTLKIE